MEEILMYHKIGFDGHKHWQKENIFFLKFSLCVTQQYNRAVTLRFTWPLILTFIIIYNKEVETFESAYKFTWSKGSANFCEIISMPWTFNFVLFVGMAIYEFKIPTKYLFTSVINILRIIKNPQIQVSMNMSIVVKPQNFVPMKLNDYTV